MMGKKLCLVMVLLIRLEGYIDAVIVVGLYMIRKLSVGICVLVKLIVLIVRVINWNIRGNDDI